MGDHALDVAESEKISESFVCCVCLDLLYKPIVLSCGHISCFWCVHKSMDGLRESRCPICRNPYNHFPTICQMFHFLLQKMYPLTYEQRRLQTLEEENRMGCFSPQFDDNTYGSLAKQELHCISNSACEASHVSSEQLESISQVQDSSTSTPAEAPDKNNEVTGTVVHNKKVSLKKQESGNCELVTVSDVLCVECKQLPFHPVALNCGSQQELHCISNSACEASHVSSEQLESISQVQDSCTSTPAEAPDENNEVTGTVVHNKKDSLKKQESRNCELVTVSDVLCVECKQLPFHPVALNCGSQQELHCISNSACEASHVSSEQLESISQVQDNCTSTPAEAPDENNEVTGTVVHNKKDSLQKQESGNCVLVTVSDVLCVECKQLLFHPVALNCGHVYCESCLIHLCDENIKCRVCESLHPTGFPKVFQELCQFLEERFPIEYALRRDAVQLKQVNSKHESLITCSTKADKQAHNVQQWSDPSSNVHFSVGCDSCGMFPIIGERYNCKDCVEEIGFDLCGDCYNTSSKLPGRFNQRHTPEHRFELLKSNTIRNIMLRLVTGQFEDGSTALVFGKVGVSCHVSFF
ncbi:E3 ubiquitin-protein ligase PRT1 isoform X2 [Morus notabilis]|uniref:E3 ubiquitin-protein ligase PRT1 isoform X2 n=1 Tax=Morus notabilis TaxID=981085 RepID=UPI000CED0BD4|nr:E3 ubiquitin-protein ligase PRT1 isoform X2 [Morus notabilis]